MSTVTPLVKSTSPCSCVARKARKPPAFREGRGDDEQREILQSRPAPALQKARSRHRNAGPRPDRRAALLAASGRGAGRCPSRRTRRRPGRRQRQLGPPCALRAAFRRPASARARALGVPSSPGRPTARAAWRSPGSSTRFPGRSWPRADRHGKRRDQAEEWNREDLSVHAARRPRCASFASALGKIPDDRDDAMDLKANGRRRVSESSCRRNPRS